MPCLVPEKFEENTRERKKKKKKNRCKANKLFWYIISNLFKLFWLVDLRIR